MSDVTTIPVLPCVSMPETLAFYGALGFEVTHQQTRPNVYAATRRGDVHLHFMGLKRLDPREAYSTCLVLVPEVERLHETFSEGLRRAYGKVPVSGFPRISRMKKGQSRFTVVDVAGNSVIFIRRDAPDDDDEAAAGSRSDSRLGRALRAAARLRDFKNDDAAAAKVLDVALARKEADAPLERARALAARLELAVALGEEARARALRAELDEAPLSEEERAQIRPLLDAVDALERSQR
ncbi:MULTISPECIES: hypothetical protein [Sorangium]|uniref:Glyoxalase n=1 Tax=Sorangium cellulosum TaxID=56 RepID=A0A4P2QU86_SORCE|nr:MULTISPECIES: hypothetical protein [Sorangium]AUX33900.1 glyoxalase [Sorangium cellulosum]WCQ93210.1 hypothetical protein NQZ70_05958 [Sorangium sp. Soce836]